MPAAQALANDPATVLFEAAENTVVNARPARVRLV
jgi:hypothetical protein